LTAASPVARWRWIGTLLASATLFGAPSGALAQTAAPPSMASIDGWIAEAAHRFDISPAWIRRVMRLESAFQPQAVSRAGAMGLMQIMPGTYAELRVRYGLGADPFHPHDNILAGAAYLRELYDRYGANGFLAAYNAGPGRYEQHLIDGQPLPAETRAYVAALSGLSALGVSPAAAPPKTTPSPPSLFAPIGRDSGDGATPHSTTQDRLFVALSPTGERR
jgi:soluble lytic murein transglycosylase-like protein